MEKTTVTYDDFELEHTPLLCAIVRGCLKFESLILRTRSYQALRMNNSPWT